MSHLKLFSQLPIGAKFHFESQTGEIFTKTSETLAEGTDGDTHPVNDGVLVFPVLNPIVSVTFTLLDGTRHVADPEGTQWRLDADYDEPGQIFNSLEDAINHLGA